MLAALYTQEVVWVCREPDGTFRLDASPPRLVFPGSFNPLHEGHTALAEIAAARFGAPVDFELSIANVDKPNLPHDKVLRRLDQFRDRGRVFVTQAPTIVQKARLFPDSVFVVGADTAARIVHPRYYRNDAAELARALDAIRDLGCRFLVGGRADAGGRFIDVNEVAIPEGYRDLFLGLTEREFRVDISSTDLRNL
jgi:hypothetical protein